MLRSLHRVLVALTLASFAMCIGMMALWLRSYSGSDYVERRRMIAADSVVISHEGASLQLSHGEVRFILAQDHFFPKVSTTTAALQKDPAAIWSVGRLGVGHTGWETPPARTAWNRFGFAEWHSGWTSSFADTQSRVWVIAAAFAFLPAVAVARWCFRSRRHAPGGFPVQPSA